MLGINCLVKNAQLQRDLLDFIKSSIQERLLNDDYVGFQNILSDIYKNNFEIDVETAGALYTQTVSRIKPSLTGILSNANEIFTSEDDIDKITGRYAADLIKAANENKKAAATTESLKGQTSTPEKNIANAVLAMLNNKVLGLGADTLQTEMKLVQERIKKYVKSLLPPTSSAKKSDSFVTIFQAALEADALNPNDQSLAAGMTSTENLFNHVQDELAAIRSKLNPAQQNMLDNHFDSIKNETYITSLTSGERRNALRDILRKGGMGKDIQRNGVTTRVVDWNKLAQYNGDLGGVVDAAIKASGQTYTPEQTDIIKRALQSEYDTIRASAQWNTANAKAQRKAENDPEFINKVFEQVAMSKGLSKMQNGKYVLDVDPAKLTDETKKLFEAEMKGWGMTSPDYEITTPAGIEKTIKKIIELDIKNGRFNGNVTNLRNIYQRLKAVNNTASPVKLSDIQKINRYRNLDAFKPLYNEAVQKVINAPIPLEVMTDIEDLMKDFQSVLDLGETELAGRNLSPDGNVYKYNFGKNAIYSQQEITEKIDRAVRKAIAKNNLPALSLGLNNAINIGMAYRLASAINVVQNTMEGIWSVIVNAKSILVNKQLRKEFFVNLADVAKGGVDFTAESGDLKVLSNKITPQSDGKSLKESITAWLKFYPNAMLGAMDAAVHSFRYKQALIDALKINMKANGYSDEKINEFIDQSLYGEAEMKRAKDIAEQALKVAFKGSKKISKQLIRREAYKVVEANLLNGNFFSEERLSKLRQAANDFALEALGKRSTVWNPFESLKQKQSDKREQALKSYYDTNDKKYINKLAVTDMLTTPLMNALLPFASGAYNWGIISLKQTGLGFSGYATKNAHKKQVYRLLASDMAATNLDDKENNSKEISDEIRDYYRDRESIRNAVQGLVHTALLYGVYLADKALGDDDEDEKSFLLWISSNSSNPITNAYFKFWSAPLVRLYNAYNKELLNPRSNSSSVVEATIGAFFNTRAPINPAEALVSIIKEPGKLVGATLANYTIAPNAAGSLFSFYNTFIRQKDVKVSAKDSPLLRDEQGRNTGSKFANNFLYGLFGNVQRAFETRTETLKTNSYPILNDSKGVYKKYGPKKLKEIVGDKPFDEVDWKDLEVKSLLNSKGEIDQKQVKKVANIDNEVLLEKGVTSDFKFNDVKKEQWEEIIGKSNYEKGYTETNVKLYFDFIQLKKDLDKYQ